MNNPSLALGHTFGRWINRTVIPVFLLMVCPPTAMLIWHVNVNLDGSLVVLWDEIAAKGPLTLMGEVWFSRLFGSAIAWRIIGLFSAIQILMMYALPQKNGQKNSQKNSQKSAENPPEDRRAASSSYLPKYADNGLASYVLTLALFLIGSLGLNLFPADIIYFNFGDILGALNLASLLFCAFLYVKSLYAPTSKYAFRSGNIIFDYYWGTEVSPSLLGLNIKQFTNCRFGMTGWALSVISFAFAQKTLYGAMDLSIIVSTLLIVLYLLKFFIWEGGYMKTMDMQIDPAGFYICWGCLVWVPALYTSPVMYMVKHPVGMSPWVAAVIFTVGITCIGINYWSDYQRQIIRATYGKATIWRRSPKLIQARYRTPDGEEKNSLLLASGFWGLSRNFHYIPELTAAFCWSCATGYGSLMPFLYLFFLAGLLGHRVYRVEKICQEKYGQYWEEYKALVPYQLIPGVI